MENNIKCIGPTKSLARIETDKNYTRELLETNNLEKYNPKYKHFENLDLENLKLYIDFCKELDMNYVIKPIGLCSGKGVVVSNEHFFSDLEGLTMALDIISSGQQLLIEEKFIGDEYTLMAYTDGTSFSYMPLVQDFKRLEAGSGANTGSMGCISYANHSLPFLDEKNINESKQVIENTIQILQGLNGDIYRGIIYGSFIKTHDGIKVIEFNSRFGDPECINVLELLQTDLANIFMSIVNSTLDNQNIEYLNQNIVSKYLVPDFYPDSNCLMSNNIYKIDKKWYETNNSNIISSSINYEDKNLYSTKSRTLVYFITSNESINEIATKINKNLNDLLNKSNTFRFRMDIGVEPEPEMCDCVINESITYQNSGVNIDNANTVLTKIKSNIEGTFNPHTLNKFGDYAGLFELNNLDQIHPIQRYTDAVLVSSIDGVGTKITFLQTIVGNQSYKIVGRDIVNHCVNDILVKGAQPLFFLDYLGSRVLVPDTISDIVESMSVACRENNCVLIGGETAEMSCTYVDNEIDIVGCMIGIVEKTKIIDGPKNINQGDMIIALPSEGLHTNGFTLIRKLNSMSSLSDELKEWMEQPHKSYLNEINLLLKNNVEILGLCHVTGGGLIENPKRVIGQHQKIILDKKKLMNRYFNEIQQCGNITDFEMYRTFNCGIGMMIFIPENNLNLLSGLFNKNKIKYIELGRVANRNMDENQIQII